MAQYRQVGKPEPRIFFILKYFINMYEFPRERSRYPAGEIRGRPESDPPAPAFPSFRAGAPGEGSARMGIHW